MALLGAFKVPELAKQLIVLDENLKTMIAVPLVVFCILSIVAAALFYEKQGKLPLAKGSICACIVGITLWAAAAPSSIVAFFSNWSLADESYRIIIAIVSILCMTGLVILYERYRKVSRTQSDD
jgi:membrane protein DedA with SNARE-associated domain